MVKWISLLTMNDMTSVLISINLGFCSQQIVRFLQHNRRRASSPPYPELLRDCGDDKDDIHLLISDQV